MTIQANAATVPQDDAACSSERAAEHAAFQSFANCYLREIDSGVPKRRQRAIGEAVDCVELALSLQRSALRIEVLATSICGPDRFGRVFVKHALETTWREIEPLSATQALLAEAYRGLGPARARGMRSRELELLGRVLDSYQQTAEFLAAARPEDGEDDGFLAAERSLAYGHWLHPTPKSRQGMTRWQARAYAPELNGDFQLVFFQADRELVTQRSVAPQAVAEIVASLAGDDFDQLAPGDGHVLIPMHPLQAEALLLDPEIEDLRARGALRALGPAGPRFAATSSVRTVYSPDADWMLKFSLPVRITNSVRRNRRHELEAGVAMAKLFERSDFLARHPQLRVLRDPAYLTIETAGRAESGFETIFRENPFRGGSSADAVAVAALTADPVPGALSRLQRILADLAEREGARVSDVAERWFEAYLGCALDPLLALYDELGVALEAHQQNALLDIRAGYPTASYYRDSQGFYLSNAYRGTLRHLAPETEDVAHLYYDDAAIRDPFAYYLVVNQIFSVISRIGRDGLADEAALLLRLRARLERAARELTGAARDFAAGLVSDPTIASKANLVTRIYDIDELAAGDENAKYQRIANPIVNRAATGVNGGGHAVAV